MGKYNQLSRYGAISKFLPKLAPSAKVFLVGDSNDAWYTDFSHVFPVDDDGVVRVYSSIDSAIGACTAGRGDVILVMPNHAETIASATSLAADVAGVSIVGLGEGNNRPTLTFATATTAAIPVSAANVTFENFRLVCDLASVATAFDVTAAGFELRKCDFYANAASKVFLISVKGNASADDIVIEDNNFNYDNATSNLPTEAIRLVGSDRARVRNNYFMGNFSTAVINNITTACTDVQIVGNRVNNKSTTVTAGIACVSGTTGVIEQNYCYSAAAAGTQLRTFIVAAGAVVRDNSIANSLGFDYNGDEKVVTRATASLPATATAAIFNVVGGPIKILNIVGEVTTAIQNQVCNTKLNCTDTASSTTTDICANLDVANKAVGTFFNITGTLANAMVATAGGTAISQAGAVVAPVGTINLTTGATNTGSVRWTLRYVPLAEGAYVTAA